MNKKTLLLSGIATVILVGCGGGSTNETPTTNGSGNSGVEYKQYTAYIPLENKKYIESYTCSETEVANSYSIGTYYSENSLSECKQDAQAWLDDFNNDEEPPTQAQRDGLAYLNDIRRGTGLPEFHSNKKLEDATKNHTAYLQDIVDTYNVNMTHYEDNNTYPSEYYTGLTGTDRAKYAGYAGIFAGDVISSGKSLTALQSITGLMTAIYHRNALLWNFTNEIGIGAEVPSFAQPHLMGEKSQRNGFLKTISPNMVIYPYPNQKDVQRAYRKDERPDPVPNIDHFTGNPVSVSFNSIKANEITMTSFKLFYDGNNTEIQDTYILTKENDPSTAHFFTAYDFALFPIEVMEGNTTYRAEFGYVEDGAEKSKTWKFTTRN